MSPRRIIGIQHKVKRTAAGDAQPTMLFILDPSKRGRAQRKLLKLESDDAELDWALYRLPTGWRDATHEDDLTALPAHHVKVRGKTTRIPSGYTGMQNGDRIVMVLGGSGDRLAYALTRRATQLQRAAVHRIPPFKLKQFRATDDKSSDAELLTELFVQVPQDFYRAGPRDLKIIALREALFARNDAMKARIACDQRLRQRRIGLIFTDDEGLYPEGGIEAHYEYVKANDAILRGLLAEENKRELDLKRVLRQMDVYTEIFEPIKGVGPMIAARLIASIIDIRRFATEHQLKAYCGAHVLPNGVFPRRRSGSVANWKPDARQALFLIGDQFNRQARSKWGIRLRENKAKMLERHPMPVATARWIRPAFKQAERALIRMGHRVNQEDLVITTGNQLLELIGSFEGTAELGEQMVPLISLLERKMKRLKPAQQRTAKRVKKMYTKMHIHKMGTWRTITQFVVWLHTTWTRFEEEKRAANAA